MKGSLLSASFDPDCCPSTTDVSAETCAGSSGWVPEQKCTVPVLEAVVRFRAGTQTKLLPPQPDDDDEDALSVSKNLKFEAFSSK